MPEITTVITYNAQAEAAMQVMMGMKKLDIAALERAHDAE